MSLSGPPPCAVVANQHGDILYATRAAAEFLGFEGPGAQEALARRPLTDLMPQPLAQLHEWHLKRGSSAADEGMAHLGPAGASSCLRGTPVVLRGLGPALAGGGRGGKAPLLPAVLKVRHAHTHTRGLPEPGSAWACLRACLPASRRRGR